jgi:hypothetical protein
LQNVSDEIINLSAAESLPVVAWHGISQFPLNGDQAGLHEQVEPAIAILQLDRGIVFVSNHAGKPPAILHNCGRGLLRPPGRLENRIANFVRRMISRKPCDVSRNELSSASNPVAG